MARVLGAVASTCLLAMTVGCSGDPGDPGTAPSSPGATAPADEPTGQTAPAGHEELSPGTDESPDGEPPTPDDALTDTELTALLRTRASAGARGHCGPDDVAVTLEGFDMALGHRFTAITVRNTSDGRCLVEGVPGIGVRGAWGRTFVPEVARGTSNDPSAPVELAPGATATSQLEWTGALRGAESEPASLIVVQLASGQVPVGVPARLVGDPADAAPLDIGELTTLKLTPFVAR